jgi:hypothetical protein
MINVVEIETSNIFQKCSIPYLPLDIRGLIWKKYFSGSVLKEIKDQNSLWCPLREQSQKLIDLCVCDVGSLQYGYFPFNELVEKHKQYDTEMWMFEECLDGKCLNCRNTGFPCLNLVDHGIGSRCKYSEAWK